MGKGGNVAGAIGRGEVRLYRFPRPDKQRPVVVLTRNSAIGYLSVVTVALSLPQSAVYRLKSC
jgi:hypothetical protein